MALAPTQHHMEQLHALRDPGQRYDDNNLTGTGQVTALSSTDGRKTPVPIPTLFLRALDALEVSLAELKAIVIKFLGSTLDDRIDCLLVIIKRYKDTCAIDGGAQPLSDRIQSIVGLHSRLLDIKGMEPSIVPIVHDMDSKLAKELDRITFGMLNAKRHGKLEMYFDGVRNATFLDNCVKSLDRIVTECQIALSSQVTSKAGQRRDTVDIAAESPSPSWFRTVSPQQVDAKLWHTFTSSKSEAILQSEEIVNAVASRLRHVFSNKTEYKRFLNCNNRARDLLNLCQAILTHAHLEIELRRNIVVAMQRLSKRSGHYPDCFLLVNADIQFETDGPIVQGGFADIYKGSLGGQCVALKFIRIYQVGQTEELMKLFWHEAILWTQLHHPNLLPVYGLYQVGARPCLVSPWMDGGNLTMYLEAHPDINRQLLAADVAAGTSYLHSQGIVHGDLKGANILVSKSGRARLADFGLSSITEHSVLKWTSVSSAVSRGGSARWQAPELFDSDDDQNAANSKASDVYAWACVCYEIFTGTIPFSECRRETVVLLKVRAGHRPAQPLRHSPPWTSWGLTTDIWNLMSGAWAQSPEERPSIEQIRDTLSMTLPRDSRPSTEDYHSPSNFWQSSSSYPWENVSPDVVDDILSMSTE